MTIDPVNFTRALIRCPSITPKDAGALDALEKALSELGFKCTRLPFSEEGTPDVDNLYARFGTSSPHFCFAGHTDVVPIGEKTQWTEDPFEATIKDGVLYGRGTSDMKGGIAAFVSAVSVFIAENKEFNGSISFLITGDEEGPAINGTIKMLQWMAENKEIPDCCIVGEPTNPNEIGDMAKIGRRGSLNSKITTHGTQGHVAYPHLADNPIPRLVEILHKLINALREILGVSSINIELDQGNDFFEPSNLEIVSVDVGNVASNIIPAQATANFNFFRTSTLCFCLLVSVD